MATPSRKLAGNLTFYDVVIATDGSGDYTDIRTAFATEAAGTRFFVKSGTYTESTADIETGTDQIVYWDDVIVVMNGFRFNANNDGSLFYGKLEVQGTGNANARALIAAGTGANADWSQCEIRINPTGAGLTDGAGAAVRTAIVSGEGAKVNFVADSLSYNTSKQTRVIYVAGPDQGRVKARVTNITNAQNTETDGIFYTGADYAVIRAIVDTVTTTVGSNGTGIKAVPSGNNSTIIGVTTGCDLANLSDTGTGNNTAALMTT